MTAAIKGFTIDELRAEVDAVRPMRAQGSEQRFRLLTVDEVLAWPVGDDLIRGVLPRTGLASAYGPSGSGKTFLVLDMIGALLTGEPWFGRRTRKASCTYIALEGKGGLQKRLRAYQEARGPLDSRP